jgi:hypothetical protein
VGFGVVASQAAIILAGGEKGMRYAMPNTRVMIHQPQGGSEVWLLAWYIDSSSQMIFWSCVTSFIILIILLASHLSYRSCVNYTNESNDFKGNMEEVRRQVGETIYARDVSPL